MSFLFQWFGGAHPAALVLISVLGIASYTWRRRPNLKHIPTVGPSGLLAYPIGSLVALSQAHFMIQKGYEKYRIFKIARYFSWTVLVNGPEYLEDIRKASDDQLSFFDAVNEAAQFDYTVGPELRVHPYHNNVVRGAMTRNIGSRFPDLIDEMDQALGDLLQEADRDWVHVPCYLSAVHLISRVSARFFVGPKLSSNPKYTDIMQSWAFHVAKTGFMIRYLPTWLKPIVSRVVFDTKRRTREVEDYLRPILTERLEKDAGKDNHNEANDMITWLWNAAPSDQRTVHDLALRMIFLSVVAIHSTSSLLTHVLFNIATYSSYIEPLRDEVSSVVQEEGWNKVAIEKMRKLDSFVKESQRLHGGEAGELLIRGKAMRDFTFSDGTFIPKGSNLAVTTRAINHDERCYPNPQEFQGFRFVEKDPLKWQMTALNLEYMAFGVGRHACPGRFFAVTEVKTIVARILLDYDIKLTDERAGRPSNEWFAGIFIAPNRKASISLRKRSTATVSSQASS